MIYKKKMIDGELLRIPAIGQGTTGTGGYHEVNAERDAQRVRVLQYGIDLEMTLIDTAEIYGGGHAEEIVAKALKGEQRDEMFLSSKFNPEHNSYTDVLAACEGSLKRLQTDYIDLYQLHWPNPNIPLEETMKALIELKRTGKIKHIGLSNVSLEEIKAVEQFTDIFSVQMEYNLFDRTVEEDILPYCQMQELLFIAYSPLDQGRIKKTLMPLLVKYNKTPAQIMLNWLITSHGVIAIPKTTSLDHTKENADATNFELTLEDQQWIDETFVQHIMMIPPNEIEVATADDRPVYKTKEEAIENRFDYIPNSTDLAKSLQYQKKMKPIRLKHNAQGTYDLIGGRIRYWGWVIAFGEHEPLPAFVETS